MDRRQALRGIAGMAFLGATIEADAKTQENGRRVAYRSQRDGVREVLWEDIRKSDMILLLDWDGNRLVGQSAFEAKGVPDFSLPNDPVEMIDVTVDEFWEHHKMMWGDPKDAPKGVIVVDE